MHLILAILVAIIVFCGFLLVDERMEVERRRRSLTARIAPDGQMQEEADELASPLDRERSARAAMMAKILHTMGVDTDTMVRKLARRFTQAGINSPDAPIYYLFFQRLISPLLVVYALSMFMDSGEGIDQLQSLMTGGFVAIVGLFGPYLYLKNKIDHRAKTLRRSFPDTLDLLLICVESGLALDAALSRVCAELGRAHPEMTEELNRTRLELALLNDRVRALMNLGERTNLVQFRSLVAALIQSERFGTSLTDTLRVLSEEFRLQRLTDAEAKAARLPVLLTIPLILLLLPALFIVILGPAAVSYYHPPKTEQR